MYQKKMNGQKPITFHHFSCKSYSLFNCLGKEVRIGVLSAATLISASAVAENSLNTSYALHKDTLSLDEVEVIGTRAPLEKERAARIVTTISHKEIVAAAAHSINDLLKLVVGVDVRQRGGYNIQSDVSINGGTFDQITLLLNGIPINNPQTGHLAFDFPINIHSIKKIEILEGASSRVFGNQAFSGAINIITLKEYKKIKINAESGSYGTFSGNGLVAFGNKKVNHNLSGSYAQSDGAVTNSYFKIRKAFYQGSFNEQNIRLNWQAGFSSKDYDANSFYTSAYPNQWEENKRYFVSTSGNIKIGSFHFDPSTSFIRSNDHFQLIKGAHIGENFHRSDVSTNKFNFWKSWALGRTSFGTELRFEEILSTNLGKPITNDIKLTKVSNEEDIYYDKKDERTNLSLYLEHDFLLHNYTISIGIMANRNTYINEDLQFYPGIDLSYRLSPTLFTFLSCNKAFRLPTFTDLYYKSPTQEGNINLKPEETTTYKLGTQFKSEIFSATINAYYNRGVNMIDWVMYDMSDKFHSTNFELDNYGISIQGKLNPKELFGKNFPISKLSAAYAYGYQKRYDDVNIYKSNYALEYLRHKFVIKLSHDFSRHLSANWSLRWKDRNGSYLVYANNKPTGDKVNYSSYAIVNGKINWSKKKYDLYLTLDNLFNHHYYDLGSVRQPGFTFMFGTNLRFDL